MRTIKPFKVVLRGKARWCVATMANGKRTRTLFESKVKASAFAQAYNQDRQNLGPDWFGIPPAERAELLRIRDEAAKLGVTLRGAVAFWARSTHPKESVSLRNAIEALLKAKKATNHSPRHVESLAWHLRAFARGREEMALESVSTQMIEEWLADRKLAASTHNGHIGRFGSLFSFAARRGWIGQNPVKGLERAKEPQRAPVILTVNQARLALAWTRRHRPDMLAYLALALMCGLRPEEAMQVQWGQINLEEGTVTVDAATSKKRSRRIVYPMPQAIVWLRIAKAEGAKQPQTLGKKTYYLRQLRKALGMAAWKQDILRHTAASYWFGETRDVGLVTDQLGHSAVVFVKHYRELVTRAVAARFWASVPKIRELPTPTAAAQAG